MSDLTNTRREYNRRTVLKMMGGAGLGFGVAACGVVTSQSSGKKPSIRPGIHISKTGAKLPTGNVTLHWADNGGGSKGDFDQALFDAYHKAHPNIQISFDQLQNQRLAQVLPLGVQNGTAPDVFKLPQPPFSIATAVHQGWVAPIDDLIPDFNNWKTNFPANTFVSGLNVFNGKTYTFPLTSVKTNYANLLFYNQQLMQRAGYDPKKKTFTWDEFRAACKKITQQGQGQYYGLIEGKDTLGILALALAELAGGPEIDWKTGKYNYTSPQLQSAVELLLAVKSDGSLFPGSLSLTQAEVRPRVPEGVAGMIFSYPTDIVGWKQQASSFKFGVAMPPIPNNGKWVASWYQGLGTNQVFVYAQSKLKEVAGDIFHYMGTPEGQIQLVIASEGTLSSLTPAFTDRAIKSKGIDPQARAAVALMDKFRRAEPVVQIRNPASEQVLELQKAVTPNLNDVVQGTLTGQVTNIKGALQDLTDRTEASLAQAIKQAQQAGVKVSRDDWVFPNWDPAKDYTPQDYKRLKNNN